MIDKGKVSLGLDSKPKIKILCMPANEGGKPMRSNAYILPNEKAGRDVS